MPLATLTQLKTLLGISLSDSSQDGALQLVLDSAEATILDLTGYSLTALTGRVDYFEDQRVGSVMTLSKRPVSGTPVVEGRTHYDTTFTTLRGSIPNVNSGDIRLLGFGSDVPSVHAEFPPREAPPGIFKWRGYTWGVVRVTYNVAALAAPYPWDLVTGLLQVVQAAYSSVASGNLTSLTVGNVSETYAVGDALATQNAGVGIPPGAAGLLARHMRKRALVAW